MFQKFWYNGGRVIFVVLILMAGVVLHTLQSASYKGESAMSLATLRGIAMPAETYFDAHGRSYEGLCDSEAVQELRKKLADMQRTGLFEWVPYEIACRANVEQYAISMTSYNDIFGEPTPYAYVCYSPFSEEQRLIERMTHVTGPTCAE